MNRNYSAQASTRNKEKKLSFLCRSRYKSSKFGAFLGKIWIGRIAIDINVNLESTSQISYNNCILLIT